MRRLPRICSRLGAAAVLLLAGASSLLAAAPADFDGNGASDVVLFRGGSWLFFDYSTQLLASSVFTGTAPGCIAAVGDYDGDGDADFSQLCNGTWHFYKPKGGYLKGIWTGAPASAQPAPADYDGDGDADVVLFDNGAWIFFDFVTGAYDGARSRWTGGAGRAVPMDYDGDGTADFSVHTAGAWHFFHDDGTYDKGIWVGDTQDVHPNIPVPLNRDADAAEEVVLFHLNTWHFFDYATGTYQGGLITGAPSNSKPTPLDVNGDGTMELGIYETTATIGRWQFFSSTGTFIKTILTGAKGKADQPVSRRLLP